ncbi:hypothetical protein ROJ8625_02723 [Roseivivax jejudonensis]|uniref:Plastocyanin n=1 Tax=Roseivivax jejudonensis TaxID=1529041 RepID=A0A1X6ZJY9_9RHOB|nr:hypothetical protein [Roseivivax jejudonensis]SLN53284.1 hypothetical protein ROJ8625_02723 [Roseivivax jejudonensis]
MRRTILAATSIVAGLAATAVSAAEHEVVILGDGFFPEIVHADPGDTIRFVNGVDLVTAATATDESWSTGLIFLNQEKVVTVTEGMTKTFDDRMPVGFVQPADESDIGEDDLAASEEEVEDWDETTAELSGTIEWETAAPILLDENGQPMTDAYVVDAGDDGDVGTATQ